jgi:predicted RNA methylase
MSSRQLDKFYTSEKVVNYILLKLNLSDYDMVIEPSAGNGAFSNALKVPVLAYDIKPENSKAIPPIKELDFLQSDISDDIKNYQSILALGNPPFGKQASLACKFFNKCASYANVNTICMIFPKSFRKVSIQNRLNLYFKLTYEEDIPSNSYLLDGNVYDVPTIFQIWKRCDIPRAKIYSVALVQIAVFTKTPRVMASIAIRRVGFYAGNATLYNDQSKQSHYFINTDSSLPVQTIIDSLNQVVWKHNDTSGPRSISKQQLIPVINEILMNK